MGKGALVSKPDVIRNGKMGRICDGYGRKVTRLTLGDLPLCPRLVSLQGEMMGWQKSAEGILRLPHQPKARTNESGRTPKSR